MALLLSVRLWYCVNQTWPTVAVSFIETFQIYDASLLSRTLCDPSISKLHYSEYFVARVCMSNFRINLFLFNAVWVKHCPTVKWFEIKLLVVQVLKKAKKCSKLKFWRISTSAWYSPHKLNTNHLPPTRAAQAACKITTTAMTENPILMVKI